jgi:transposase
VQPGRSRDKKKQKRQACKKGHYFVVIADRDHVFFEYTEREGSNEVLEIFRGFSGYVQADAKSVYDILFRDHRVDPPDGAEPDFATRSEVACWYHARRGFWEAAIAANEAVAREALFRIGRLFDNEEKWRALAPAQRKEMRDRFSRPELDAFFAWAEIEFRKVEHQRGLLRSALGYVRNHAAALLRFLEDGRLEMDNNGSERQLRRIAVGRKAWLFVGSNDHAEATGHLFSLIASAKLHGLDIEGYLRDLFRVLPHWPEDRYLELAPKYWAATRTRLDAAELEREIGSLTIPPRQSEATVPG